MPRTPASPRGVPSLDKHGCIVRANPQAEYLFGYSEEELRGRPGAKNSRWQFDAVCGILRHCTRHDVARRPAARLRSGIRLALDLHQ